MHLLSAVILGLSAITTTFGQGLSLDPLETSQRHRAAPATLAPRAMKKGAAAVYVGEVGANHRVWLRPEQEPSQAASPPNPQESPNSIQWKRGPAGKICEIASGLNYWDGEKWAPSEASFQLSPSGEEFVAARVQHRVRLAANINTPRALSVRSPDGVPLETTPVALVLYDTASGRSGLLANVRDSFGVMVASNQIVFADAFEGACADVIVTLQRGSLEQDVRLTSRINVADYGYPPETTRIQVVSESFGNAEPERVRRPLYVEGDEAVRRKRISPDVIDEVLGFGEFVLATGRAFRSGHAAEPEEAIPVAKQFVRQGNRAFIVESVSYSSIEASLKALPECHNEGAALGLPRRLENLASIPSPQPGRSLAASKNTEARLVAWRQDSAKSGVVIDFMGTLGGSINTNAVFAGDTTWFVSGPTFCNGSAVIEGGAIFKFPTSTAYIQFNGSVTCATTAYRPAIFTAADDTVLGEEITTEIWSGYQGVVNPDTFYANPALVFNYTSPQLSNLRFKYCREAVQMRVVNGLSIEVADCQIVHCLRGLYVTGSSGSSGSAATINVNNTLFGYVTYPFKCDAPANPNAYVTQCTVDDASLLLSGTATTGGWTFRNSVFANVTNNFSGGGNPSGITNGFFRTTSFGSGPVPEAQDASSPFAPTTFIDGGGIERRYWAYGQGAYYLRSGSPFLDAGDPGCLSTALKANLAKRTTSVPDPVCEADITSVRTLSPQPIRDVGTPDLGYHYPAVDHILYSVTVNNTTLNVDPGTVLAFVGYHYGPYQRPWGLRVNVGGRLNVNGVPTNRVVFARLEAVQESPYETYTCQGPTITFEGLWFASGPATPLPEARIRHADFAAICQPYDNYGHWPVHFGPIDNSSHEYYYSSSEYADIGVLELDGCHIQGGEFLYGSGGLAPRTLTLRNNIFERCEVIIQATMYWQAGEQLTAVNNLFYRHYMCLKPGSGVNWTFRDNLFDNVSWFQDGGQTRNGPVTLNDYNGYIGMTNRHLTPIQQANTDKDLSSLVYQTGSLGRFYLPTSASQLIDTGSRSSDLAGLYHFTSFTSNTKETNSVVNMGPHYVALVSGKPADSNSDGIADFLADRNGDGSEAGETLWTSPNNGQLAVISPTGGIVSGTVRLNVRLGANGGSIDTLYPLVDGVGVGRPVAVRSPGATLAQVEIDTRYLNNGPHYVRVAGYRSTAEPAASTEFSDSISVNVLNQFCFPLWQDRAELLVNAQLFCPASEPSYTISFFNHDYPKSYDPYVVSTQTGIASEGSIRSSATPASLGFGANVLDPVVYSFTETRGSQSSSLVANPNIVQGDAYPLLGLWAAAYADNIVDYHDDPVIGRIADVRSPFVNPITQFANETWMHESKLNNGWLSCGFFASGGGSLTHTTLPTPGHSEYPQTWPVRMGQAYERDRDRLLAILCDPNVRNFYGYSHGNPFQFMAKQVGDYGGLDHRFRFVFLDGCRTSMTTWLFSTFGATGRETLNPVYPPEDANPLSPTDWNYYKNEAGIRPAAFMGWKADSSSKVNANPPIVDQYTQTGNPCDFKVYAAMCNWHVQFLFAWMLEPNTLTAAITYANNVAMGVNSDPPVDHSLMATVVAPGSIQTIEFNPRTCLRVYGYGDLLFNGLNHLENWP
jgi:hypothetical protein